jgi:phosphoglycolate phosphatase
VWKDIRRHRILRSLMLIGEEIQGRWTMKFQAVIFDLDGTLLDTLEDLACAGNRVLQAGGFPVHPVDQYRYFVGDGLETLIQRIVPEGGRNKQNVSRLIAAFRVDYGKNWQVKTRLYDGIDRMLDRLEKHRLRLNILSNKPQDFTEACVETFLGNWAFNHVFGQRAGCPKKPDPAGALEIARLSGIDPSAILYLGDTATDMITARGAGMFPVGVLWGFRGEDELRKSGAERLIRYPDELVHLCLSMS